MLATNHFQNTRILELVNAVENVNFKLKIDADHPCNPKDRSDKSKIR